MATMYALSYIGILGFTLLWYFLEAREKPTTVAKTGFPVCVLLYLIFFVFADRPVFFKFFVMFPRDIGIFLFIVLAGHYLARRTAVYLIVILAVTAFFYFYYFPVLKNSYMASRVALDPSGEILFDVKSHDRLNEIKSALAKYNPEIQIAFPHVSRKDMTELDDYYTLNLPDAHDDRIDDALKILFGTNAVDWAERNEVIALSPLETEKRKGGTDRKKPDYGLNDPFLARQWGFGRMNIEAYYKLLSQKKIKPKKSALIAVLDTGIEAAHEDLKKNYVSTKKEYDRDVIGHGTHCAGIACAVSNNKIGIASMSPDSGFVRVTSIKVLDDSGRGSQRSIIDGMIRAVDRGADVLSMSLGGLSNDTGQRAYGEVIRYARSRGAIVVAAAGNNDSDAKNHLPAGAEGVITVTAVDESLKKADFSNHVNHVKMGVAAPGVEIYSTIPGNEYAYYNGTSMATPYVSSLVGILKAVNPKLETKDIFRILEKTGKKTGDPDMTGMFVQPADAVLEAMK